LDKELEMSDFPVKILVGTDGSEDAELAARAAVSLARDTDSELHIVHVGETYRVYLPRTGGPIPPPETDEEVERQAQWLLDQQVQKIQQAGGAIAESHLRLGKPAEEILHVSEEIVAGLIVVGNQGIGGKVSRMKRFLMGSVSERVTRYARCSVMVVRRDLYERPPS
jgi:nucleotide-binding universal stress UspA family protein